VSNAEQYCKAHASNVTLEEVQAIFADADTSQAPKAGAAPLTDAELEYFREWAARFNSPMATWVNIPPPPIQVNTRSLLATIDADRVELSRLRRIESRAKEQIAHHVNKPDLPHSTAYYTARFILKGTFVLVDDVLAAIGET
jgi:hypothetical protein